MSRGSTHSYIRDAVPATVEWDSPSCHNAQTMCTGANWTPQMRVQFNASYAFGSGRILQQGTQPCNTGWHLRCDDPQDLSPSGGVGAPLVQSTLALQDALVQVRTTGTGAWNTLKDYQFYYNINGPRTTTDASTGNAISAAGYFLLEQLKVVGLNGLSLPTTSFEYTSVTQYYEDSNYHPTPPTNCGPSWNTGTGSGCLLWSQNQPGNSYFLNTFENGLGLHEVFYWQLARNNTHGAPNNGVPSNPFYCNGYQTTSPCQEADDQNWSRVVLTKTESSVVRRTASADVTVTSRVIYSYYLTYPLAAQECSDCTAGMYWGNQNDGDYLDYYNGKFMGFAGADVSNPDGSVVSHKYYATEGYGIYNIAVPCLAFTPPCHAAPWWHVGNAAHGRAYEVDYKVSANGALLRQDTAQYQVVCPPSGVAGSPSWNSGSYTYTWDGKLVAELDHGNPVAVCDVQMTQSLTNTFNGAANYARSWTNYSYDGYGRVTDATSYANDGGGVGSPTSFTSHIDYLWNDNVTASGTGATGTYLVAFPAQRYIADTGNTSRTACARFQYDGAGYVTGQQSSLALGELTSSNSAVDCGNAGNGWTPSGVMRATAAYDTYGNVVATTDPLGVAGDTSHKGCTLGTSSYTSCLVYDGTYHTQVITATNTLNQIARVTYAQDASGAFGLWPTSTTDINGNITSYVYDGLGRLTSETLPDESLGISTMTWAYVVTCGGPGTGPQSPCVRTDQTQRLNATTTVAAHAFYDGYGHLIETRTQAPGGQDVLRFAMYDASNREFRFSTPYFVTAWDGVTGNGYANLNDNQSSTYYTYDGLGRTLTVKDPIGYYTATTSYSVACNVTGTDSSCYGATTVTDANDHRARVYTDAFGRATYTSDDNGNSTSGYTTYRTISATYDYAGNETAITQPNGSATTFSYDAAGRQLAMTDPDRGHETYSYDANGNILQATDARSVSIYAGYDGLNRQLWRNGSNTPTGAYLSYSYDDTSGTNQGLGRLTGESFSSPTDGTLSGSYHYTYDTRGELTASDSVLLGTTYTTAASYDDAGDPISLTYPDNTVAQTSYDPTGWFAKQTWTHGGTPGTTETLLDAASYSGADGAWGTITSATIGTLAGNALYSYSAHDDGDGRLTESTVKRVSDNATLFDELLSYDPVGNVAGIATTLASGVDHQQFCYDEHNRLTWASATQGATGPCGAIIGANTVPGASYTQSFSYDTLDRLTSGPAGSYSYGDSAHLHGATTVGSGSTAYTARYDAAGDMVCRAPTGSTSCAGGTNTGQQLTWDLEGRLAAWQDAPTSPTTTASYLYDGEGQRVAQRVTASGTTTTTTYVGSLAEYATTGGTTSRTDYLYAAGKLVAEAVTSSGTTTLSYLVANAQGTPLEALDGSGNVTASRLYTPYGASRYTSGAFPTSYGYTGQRNDTATELDYYGARYYDPTVGQFTSADTVMAGLSRYGYVGGNPISRTDPSGHMGEKSEKGGGTAVAEGGETTENLQKTVSAGASLFNPGAGSASQIIGLVLVLGAVAIFIKGSFVSSDGSDLIVKSPDGSSATRYSPGDPEYNTWSQAYNDALKDTDVWNARTAPKSGPKPSEPRAPVSEPAGSTPPTPQPGGGSVGAGTPGGGGGGVASPAHPEEDPCACYRTDLSGSKRLDRPPTPQGMSLPEFGKLMQWGRGSEAARAAIGTLSRDILLQRGVTAEMAAAWRDFYINESIRVPGNPSAPGRVDLMQWVCELLR